MNKILLVAFLLSSALVFTSAYRDTEEQFDDDDNEIEGFEDLNDINDDIPNFEELEDEDDQRVEDPMPFRIRTRRFRRAIRRVRVRIRVRRLKCPLRCAAYYTCLAKSSGIARMFCYKLKKSCRC